MLWPQVLVLHIFLTSCFRTISSTVMLAKLVLCTLQGSVGQNKLASFVMEGAHGGSGNLAKHKKRKSPVQKWRPISTEAVPQKGASAPSAICIPFCTLTKDHHNS